MEVIDVVREVSGVPAPAVTSPRRPGDPAAIVAFYDSVRAEIGWVPRHDDLRGIVAQALARQRGLQKRGDP